ncbi:MAG TPA: hypothetical protein PLK31_03660, partial [Chloroflexota bacterium]|nr:hypothetical protein [Chloroflexota bacterium]
QSGLLLLLTGPLVAQFGVMGAALVWLPAVGAAQFVSVVYARLILPRPFQGIGRPAIAISLVTIIGGLIATGIAMLWPGVVGLIVAGGTAVIVMVILLWQADLALKLGLQANLTLAFPPLARLKILSYKL